MGLHWFCDFDKENYLDTCKSNIGNVVPLTSDAISWRFKLWRIVALSTTEAECISATEVSKKSYVWLILAMSLVYLGRHWPYSQNAICLATNAMFHACTWDHFMREVIDDGLILLRKISTVQNHNQHTILSPASGSLHSLKEPHWYSKWEVVGYKCSRTRHLCSYKGHLQLVSLNWLNFPKITF